MKFQWLKDYQELSEQIAYLQWDLNKSKMELIRWTEGDLSNVKLEKESKASNLDNIIARLEGELTFKREMQESLLVLINSFSGVENKILRCKYVEGMNLEEIARETSYSPSYIRTKHAELKRRLDFIDEYEANMLRYRSDRGYIVDLSEIAEK